jgi:hypothetical protein
MRLQKRAIRECEPMWLVGLHNTAADAKWRGRKAWSSDQGVVGPSGLAVFDLRRIHVGRAITR